MNDRQIVEMGTGDVEARKPGCREMHWIFLVDLLKANCET